MNSRRKIEKFCKDRCVYVDILEYERKGQHIYGDYSDESEWYIKCRFFADNRWITEEFWNYTADDLINDIKDEIDSYYKFNDMIPNFDCEQCADAPCEACDYGI